MGHWWPASLDPSTARWYKSGHGGTDRGPVGHRSGIHGVGAGRRLRRITVSGQITPAAALVRDATTKPYLILNRFEGHNTYYQLTFPAGGIVPRSGRFILKSADDKFGKLRRNTYALEFDPAPASGYQQFIKAFTVRLTK